MTMDREKNDKEVESLPHYVRPDPESTLKENERSLWAERWGNMLPETSCRFVPEHGPLEALVMSYDDDGKFEGYAWGHGPCQCLPEQQPLLNNPLSLMRRKTSIRMLNRLAFRVWAEDAECVGKLYAHQQKYIERLAGLAEIFEKRKPAMKDYIQVIKPLTYPQLQEQVLRHVNYFAPMMTRYCHDIQNSIKDWVKQMDPATYDIEAKTCRERQHFVEMLVINLVARDPGLTFERQKNVINWFFRQFFVYSPRVQNHDIRAGDEDYFIRLQHMSMRDGLENKKRMRQWVQDAVFASKRGIQLHTAYQLNVAEWEKFKKEHYEHVSYLEVNIVDATEKDIARLNEENRACPVCGDDLKELHEAKPIPGRRKQYLVPAQPRTCWTYQNDHWFCRSCLLRCALTREGKEKDYKFVKPRCPLCRKNYNPHENYRDEQQRKRDQEQERQRRAQVAAAATQPALPGPPGPSGTPAPPAQPFQPDQASPPRAPTLAQVEGQHIIPQAQASNLVPSPGSHTVSRMPSIVQLAQAAQAGQPIQTTEAVDSDIEMTGTGTDDASTEYDDNAEGDPFVQPVPGDDRMEVDEEAAEEDVLMEYY